MTLVSNTVMAQANYPQRPITVIIPMAAGGASDVLMRSLSTSLSQELGQAIIIDNRAGANGLIGEDLFSKANADGYTLMFGTSSATTNLWLHSLSYDPRKVFVPMMRVGAVPMALIVNNKNKVSDVKELISLAKKSSPPLDFATWGEGSISHLSAELFRSEANINLHHIPYKTSPQALNDTLSGQVDLAFVSLAAASQQIKGGRVNVLAITSKDRSPNVPQIPTMIESGLPNVVIESWFGFFTPQGINPETFKIIQTALTKVISKPEIRKNLENQGYRVVGDTPEEFRKFYLQEIEQNGKILKSMKSN
jgi:tripartite-type tricarboxylate transporter receptor subunit TctC